MDLTKSLSIIGTAIEIVHIKPKGRPYLINSENEKFPKEKDINFFTRRKLIKKRMICPIMIIKKKSKMFLL